MRLFIPCSSRRHAFREPCLANGQAASHTDWWVKKTMRVSVTIKQSSDSAESGPSKRGARSVKGGEVELLERLGSNDPCPCGSGRRFQEAQPQ
jgi:uncharacterized protein YecA (UPF0149 family)